MIKSIKNTIKAVLLALPLLFTSCIQNSTASTRRADTPRIILEKSCHGTCSNYTAKFYLNNTVKVFPKSYFKVSQNSQGTIEKGRIKELINQAEKIGFWDFEKEYDNKNLQDAPTTYISVGDSGKHKKIKVRANAPKELVDFIKSIEKEIKSVDWKPIK